MAALLKACEIRAIVELTKFLQVKLDNLYLIGIDCPGTFEVPDYAKMAQEGKGGEKSGSRNCSRAWKRGMSLRLRDMPSGLPARCVNILSRQADIVFKLFGYKTDQEIGIEVGEKLEKEIEEKGILSLTEEKGACKQDGSGQ